MTPTLCLNRGENADIQTVSLFLIFAAKILKFSNKRNSIGHFLPNLQQFYNFLLKKIKHSQKTRCLESAIFVSRSNEKQMCNTLSHNKLSENPNGIISRENVLLGELGENFKNPRKNLLLSVLIEKNLWEKCRMGTP